MYLATCKKKRKKKGSLDLKYDNQMEVSEGSRRVFEYLLSEISKLKGHVYSSVIPRNLTLVGLQKLNALVVWSNGRRVMY